MILFYNAKRDGRQDVSHDLEPLLRREKFQVIVIPFILDVRHSVHLRI